MLCSEVPPFFPPLVKRLFFPTAMARGRRQRNTGAEWLAVIQRERCGRGCGKAMMIGNMGTVQ